MQRIENWLLQKFAGKIVARASVTIAGAVVAGMAQPKVAGVLSQLAAHGVSVSLDPDALAAGIVALAHAAFEAYKAWRAPKAAPQAQAATGA